MSPVLAGLALGLGVGTVMWVVALRRRSAELRGELAAREEALARLHQDLASAREAGARLGAELAAHRQSSAEKLAVLQGAEARLREAFSALSSDALKQNNESFLQLARASLGEFQKTASMDLDGRHKAIETLVLPLRDSLTKVDTKLQEVERGRATSQAQLSEQLRSLTQSQQVLQSETSRLSRALRSPNVRGQWGELQLRRVLETAGMVEGSHYEIKESARVDESRLTPDVLVRLPGGKNVVVDAKVPLTAYLDAGDLDDDALREVKLRDHARQVRDHVVRLGNKTYWAHFQPAPDIVVMFVPGEALLHAAMQHDTALLEFSMARGVMLASPLTLVALLRAIAYGWQQETIAKNAQEISELGRNLYDRIAKLAEHFESVGKSLAKAVQSYNSAVGTLESRVLVTARRLKDKGVTATEEFPELETIDQTPRALGAAELTGLFEDVPGDGTVLKESGAVFQIESHAADRRRTRADREIE
ncbi:MAG: DNA recombination protein RmuC [Acidobacteria bacterium]|nr:DNA recombination protein RmuC [Acidobacteriota bacterium]